MIQFVSTTVCLLQTLDKVFKIFFPEIRQFTLFKANEGRKLYDISRLACLFQWWICDIIGYFLIQLNDTDSALTYSNEIGSSYRYQNLIKVCIFTFSNRLYESTEAESRTWLRFPLRIIHGAHSNTQVYQIKGRDFYTNRKKQTVYCKNIQNS